MTWKVLSNYKKPKLWEEEIYINEDFSVYTVEERKNLFKPAKEIRERSELVKVTYNRVVSY